MPLKHFDARTIQEAITLLGQYGEEARMIAGGVDLVGLMKNRVVSPKALVNIKTIPGLDYIREDGTELKMGTLTSLRQLETSALIRTRYPMIAEAAHSIAAPQVRNMATVGGNLCQQVQCWYYRRSPATGISFFCSRKGGDRCYALAGENAYHAILSKGKCPAVCPSDLAPALVALDATVRIAGPDGERHLSLASFFTSLGTTLRPDEMLLEIQVPVPRPETRQRFLKFRLRKTIDFAISSVAAAITVESGSVREARMVLGGVAPTPYRVIEAENNLKGKTLTEEIAETTATVAMAGAVPLSRNAYKIPITRALLKNIILRANGTDEKGG